MRVHRHDPDELPGRAAVHIAELLRDAVERRGHATMAVSGGDSPTTMFKSLAALDVDWRFVHLFQVDERIAPRGHEDRNLTLLQDAFVSRCDLSHRNVHSIRVEESPDLVVPMYEDELRRWCGTPPVLDVVHLGLGTDGHTASLIPGDSTASVMDHDVIVSQRYRGRKRVSLSRTCIERADRIVWYVPGRHKRAVLEDLVFDRLRSPAGGINHAKAEVFTDLVIRLRADPH